MQSKLCSQIKQIAKFSTLNVDAQKTRHLFAAAAGTSSAQSIDQSEHHQSSTYLLLLASLLHPVMLMMSSNELVDQLRKTLSLTHSPVGPAN